MGRSISFLVFTFLLTWLLWLPGVLENFFSLGIPSPLIFTQAIAGTFVPSAMGLVMIKNSGKRIRPLLRMTLGLRWWPVWFIVPASVFFGILSVRMAGGFSFVSAAPLPENWLILPLLFLGVLIFLGPLGEEFGWRGVLQLEMERHFGNVGASLVTGAFWSLWHVPAFFIKGSPQSSLPLLPFIVTLMIVSVLIGWVQSKAEGSLWPALLIHTLVNFSADVFGLVQVAGGSFRPWMATNGILLILTLFLVLLTRKKELPGIVI